MTIDKENAAQITEIKTALIKHYSDDEKEFQSINNKLDNISAAMVQESKGKDATNESMREEYVQLRKDIKELSDKVTPVVNWFDNINFSKKAIMWILGLLGSIVALALGFKSLIK